MDHFEIQDSGSSYPTGSLPPCQDDRSCCIEIESKFNFERLDVPVTPISSCPQSSLQLIVSPSSHIASATHTEPNTFYTSKDPAFDMLSTNVYNESCQHRELDGERVQEFSKSCCFAASSPVCVTKDPFADISNHDNILTESHTKIPLPTDSDGMVDVLRTADNPKEHKPTPAPPPPTPPTLSPALSCQPENTSILSDVESPASAIFHDRRHTHSLKYKGGAIQAAAGTAVLTEVYEVEVRSTSTMSGLGLYHSVNKENKGRTWPCLELRESLIYNVYNYIPIITGRGSSGSHSYTWRTAASH